MKIGHEKAPSGVTPTIASHPSLWGRAWVGLHPSLWGRAWVGPHCTPYTCAIAPPLNQF